MWGRSDLGSGLIGCGSMSGLEVGRGQPREFTRQEKIERCR
jgi:hypothetical protein